MHRQLAAVLAADICNYTRLMQEDASATLQALRRLRAELFGPAVASRRGRIIKNMGDGWIVLFTSAADAAACAMAIQDGLTAPPPPGEPQIKMRIGVHLGDIVEENEDIFGDGVNVASRLEAAAEPGAIAITEAVFGALDGTLRPSFDNAGAWNLKNIDRPMPVWVRGAQGPRPMAINTANRLKLIVRPTTTSDPRDEVCELADALTGDLAGYLDVPMWLTVTTSETGQDAAFILNSRLRGRADKLRLEVQLIETGHETLFAKKHDGNLADAFDWQDNVGEVVAAHVIEAIYQAAKRRLGSQDLSALSAEECVLRAQLEAHGFEPAAIARSMEITQIALQKDPDCAAALAQMLATIGMVEELPDLILKALPAWLDKADALGRDHPFLQLMATQFRLLGIGPQKGPQPPDAFITKPVETALRRAPFDFLVLRFSGWMLLFLGKPALARDCLQQGLKLGRGTPWEVILLSGLAMACLQEDKKEQAITYIDKCLPLAPGYPVLYRIQAATFAHMGEMDKAKTALATLEKVAPGSTITRMNSNSYYADSVHAQRYEDGLRLAGMPE